MNPLVWRGPEFLLFYAVVAAALLLWQFVRGRQREESAAATVPDGPTSMILMNLPTFAVARTNFCRLPRCR